MIDNFIDDDFIEQYHSYNKVYNHESGFNIFLGDASAANNHQFIKNQKIGLIVTAAINMEHLKYEQHIKHYVYSLIDAKTQNMMLHFSHFYNLIEQHIHRHNILVHCFAGVSRSATLVISYVMKKNKMSFKQAVAQIRKYRHTVLPNLGFQRQLKQYEKILKFQQISTTRKMISKTSQSRKHHLQKKVPQIQLPQIFALGKTLGRPKIPQPPLLQPSSQMQSRKMRAINLQQLRLGVKQIEISQHNKLNNYQPLTNRLPLKSFRKRSISISHKVNKHMIGSDQSNQLVRLPPHKLAIQQIKFGAEKVIKSAILKDFYN